MSRKPKLDPAKVAQANQMIKDGKTMKEVCAFLERGKKTVNKYIGQEVKS